MASMKEFIKNLKLTEAEKATMTPEEIAEVEAALEEARKAGFATAQNPARFDAKGMVPVDFPEGQVIPWKTSDDDKSK